MFSKIGHIFGEANWDKWLLCRSSETSSSENTKSFTPLRFHELKGAHPGVHLLGDAYAPRRMTFATRQAWELASLL